MALDKLLNLSVPIFPLYKIKAIIVSTAKGYEVKRGIIRVVLTAVPGT